MVQRGGPHRDGGPPLGGGRLRDVTHLEAGGGVVGAEAGGVGSEHARHATAPPARAPGPPRSALSRSGTRCGTMDPWTPSADAPCSSPGAAGGLGRVAVARAARSGARLVLVGRDEARLQAAAAQAPGQVSSVHVVDLLDADAVDRLAAPAGDAVDVVWHLVGGWRGGPRLPEQTLDDWALAVRPARADHGPRRPRVRRRRSAARPAGRFAIVSSPKAVAPTSTNAAYAAGKAGSRGGRAGPGGRASRGAPPRRTSSSCRHRSRMRAADRPCPLVTTIAAALVYLTSDAAATMNGQRIRLYSGGPA